jgi:hypothetical protein
VHWATHWTPLRTKVLSADACNMPSLLEIAIYVVTNCSSRYIGAFGIVLIIRDFFFNKHVPALELHETGRSDHRV